MRHKSGVNVMGQDVATDLLDSKVGFLQHSVPCAVCRQTLQPAIGNSRFWS